MYWETGGNVNAFSWELWDVNENRQHGMTYTPKPGPQAYVSGTAEHACMVGDFANCPGDFSARVRRYMER